MLFWPAVAALGFLVLAGLVIALGTSSTARYEFERNRVQGARQESAAPVAPAPVAPAPVPAAGPAGRGAEAGGARVTGNAGAAAQDERRETGMAVSVANHPAGKRAADPGAEPAWWLVDELDDEPGGRIVAGPFPDLIEADWAALSGGAAETARVRYGVPRAEGGGLVRRQLPQERAWLAELGDQLDRLDDDWNELLTDEDVLTTLVVEVAAAVVEAGLALHDCAGDDPAGGVCLTPHASHGGVVVSWHRHDRMGLHQVRGAAMDAAVQRTMNAAVTDLLVQMGFGVEEHGPTGCCLVTAAPGW